MQSEEWIRSNIAGAEQLCKWFGRWPDFHDAEVLELHLLRTVSSRLTIHAFDMTNEIGPDRRFVLDKHVVVTFTLHGVQDLDLNGFDHQNVILELSVGPAFEYAKDDPNRYHGDTWIRLSFAGCDGLGGSITAERVEVTMSPGKPVDSTCGEPGPNA
jgi:hypothetical protein